MVDTAAVVFCAFACIASVNGFSPVYPNHRNSPVFSSQPVESQAPWLRYPKHIIDGYPPPQYSNNFQQPPYLPYSGQSHTPTEDSLSISPKPATEHVSDSVVSSGDCPAQTEVAADPKKILPQKPNLIDSETSEQSLAQNMLQENQLIARRLSRRRNPMPDKRYIQSSYHSPYSKSTLYQNNIDHMPENDKFVPIGKYKILDRKSVPFISSIQNVQEEAEDNTDRVSLLNEETLRSNGDMPNYNQPFKFCAAPIVNSQVGREFPYNWFEHREQPNDGTDAFGTASTVGRSPIPIALQLHGTEGCQDSKHVYGHFVPEGIYTPKDRR